MKMIGKTVAILLLVSGAVLCGSEKGAIQFGSIKVKATLESTPAMLRSSGTSGVYSSGGASFTNHRWLVIHASYVPGMGTARNIAAARESGSVRAIQPVAGRWIDDVTARVIVAYPAENARRSNVVYGLFEGECRIWSVRLDGKRRTLQMFVPPQLLDRYAAVAGGGRREVSLGPTDYRILVEFFDKNGKLLGRACEHTGSLRGNKAFEFFKDLKNNPGTTVIPGALLPRNKTPWAWHQFSTFDYIKDTGDERGASSSGKQ